MKNPNAHGAAAKSCATNKKAIGGTSTNGNFLTNTPDFGTPSQLRKAFKQLPLFPTESAPSTSEVK